MGPPISLRDKSPSHLYLQLISGRLHGDPSRIVRLRNAAVTDDGERTLVGLPQSRVAFDGRQRHLLMTGTQCSQVAN